MIKAAFFDVDGTLLSHKTKQVPPSTRTAIAKLKAAGILCIAATGRQIGEMEKLPVGDIAFDGYVMLNGQMLLDGDKNLISATPITGMVKDYLIRCFREKTFPALMVERDRVYLNYVDDHVEAVQEAISSQIPPLGTYSGGEIYQVCAYLKKEQERLIAPIEADCTATRWNFGGLDIIAKGGGKIKGIQELLAMKGLHPEEIIAFGDGENDVEMLRFAGIGVAMGNGEEITKEAADYITSGVDEDGIERALKHFHII